MVTLSELEDVLGSRGRIRVAKVFFENENDLLSIRKTSKLANIAYSKAYRYVKELEKAGLVRKYHKYYIINKDSEIYEKLKPLFLEEVKNESAMSGLAKKFLDIVKSHKSCGIYVHHNADPDAVGSGVSLSIALKKLGISNEVVVPASLSAQSKALLSKYPYPVVEKSKGEHDLIIVVDTASEEQIPCVDLEGKTIIVIDHHQHGELREKAHLAIIDPNVKATSILVYELIKSMKVNVDAQIQFFLSVGIVADTGFLRKATNREIKILAELMKNVELQEVMSAIHMERSRSERIAVLKAMRRMKVYDVDGTLLAISEIGSFEAACALAMVKVGADVAIVANIGKNEIRISCRTNEEASKKLTLVRIFKKLEKILHGQSGGHETAISFNGSAPENWDDARELILKELESKTKKKIKRIG
jgi:nanoRNase/pAp phosphatase (c-di-AMP/oligoRNAs hydrolase)/predicted transcriptional regulator